MYILVCAAIDHLPECTLKDPFAGRAGLVGTQNIRNNESRSGGLDYVVKTATIIEAIENQPWSGEASVHVSIVNWVKSKDKKIVPPLRILWTKVDSVEKRERQRGSVAAKQFELISRTCQHINSSLSDATDVSEAEVLSCNRDPKRCFEGIQTGSTGFRLTAMQRDAIAKSGNEASVVFPFLGGDDFLKSLYLTTPAYVIDFGDSDMLAASAFPLALKHVQNHVLPKWVKNAEGRKG